MGIAMGIAMSKSSDIMNLITAATWGLSVENISAHYSSKEDFYVNALAPQIASFVARIEGRVRFSENEEQVYFTVDDDDSVGIKYSQFLSDLAIQFNHLHRQIIPGRAWLGDDTALFFDVELKKLTDSSISAEHDARHIAIRAKIAARKSTKKAGGE